MKHLPRKAIYKLLIIVPLLAEFLSPEVLAQERIQPTSAIEEYYDLSFKPADRDSFQTDLEDYRNGYKAMHAIYLENAVSQPLIFNPYPSTFNHQIEQQPVNWELPDTAEMPSRFEDLAFYPVSKLAQLISNRKVTSVQLTRLYLDRLKKFGDTLQCVITILEVEAMEAARRADEEIAAGNYKGPLHGMPFGVKDLFAVKGTRTTWGAMPFIDQEIDLDATVVQKLRDAGAVLVAKLTMGALAMGDVWYGGKTKNPWNLAQGSSGSSAGSASATSAGLVAFSIGTETWGSIVSPSTRCGATGLRPTIGSVSRYGAMALSWSMDKVGPICRSALDCALVFDAIRGFDGHDISVRNAPFNYDARSDLRSLKVGYLKSLFEEDTLNRVNNQKVLEWLRGSGVQLIEVKLPDDIPVEALTVVLSAEAAAVFDDLTRSGKDSMLTRQDRMAWPTIFRSARFIPAVEYLNAQRLRYILVERYHEKTSEFDVIVAPTFGGDQLLMTNLTGHPCLVLPNGFSATGAPTSISLLGRLHGEAALITVGRAIQEKTDWDDQVPPLFR